MRTWRIVTFTSIGILAAGLALIFTTPLRYPGYFIFSPWPTLLILVPAAILCALLLSRLVVGHRVFSILVTIAGLLCILLVAANLMPLVVLPGALVAIGILFIASRPMEPPRTT